MKVYHGALCEVRSPKVNRGRTSTDFGQGFYTTTNMEQAKEWAIKKQKTSKSGAAAIINIYEVDDNLLYNPAYRIKIFEEPNSEWLQFVIDCRRSLAHQYDIVFGAVANDKIYTTITLYEASVLTAEETIARLKADEYFNQISFHNQEVANGLRFIASEIISQ